MKKVILISVDGMRPDGFLQCGNAYTNTLMTQSSHTLSATTVVPSVTLPCHLSLFYSIPPARHGTITNTFMPPVHPINGLFEQLKNAGKKCAMFYSWEPIRQVAGFNNLKYCAYINAYEEDCTDAINTDRALECIHKYQPDFVFLYMVETDEKGGHDNGWMTKEYLHRISLAIDNIKRVCEECGEDYTIIITADHGGHDRTHGTQSKEDMTIPVFFLGKDFTAGRKLENVSILDIAPTIADIIGIYPAANWEGKSLLEY